MNMDKDVMNTHGYLMKMGKHKGTLLTRVPVGYLQWGVNANHPEADYFKAELKRRGSVMPAIQISGHAIDRASLKCRAIWHQNRKPEEGLHGWLVRVSQDAIEKGQPMGEGAFYHLGIKFIFAFGEAYPSLVTVMPKRRLEKEDEDPDPMANVHDGQEPDEDVDAHWGNGSEEY
jgi:hypothetical protein